MEIYLQHGVAGGPYQTERVEHRETPAPRSGNTTSGYGSRIPTGYMVRYLNRWRRVYAICYSNSPSHYIRFGAENSGRTFVTFYN